MALTRVAAAGISTGGSFVLENINTSGIVTAGTVQVGSATTIHSGGIDLGGGNITSHNINSTGIITATGGFVGAVTGNVTGNLTGDVTGDLTGNVTGNLTGTATTASSLSGTPNVIVGVLTATDAVINGNLTVQGTTTTLDTTLTEVDKLEVGANNTTVGVAITQSGSGDILRLYDGATQVVTVADGGNFGIGSTNPSTRLHIAGTATPQIRIQQNNSSVQQQIEGSGGDLVFTADVTNAVSGAANIEFWRGTTQSMLIDGSGRLLVGTSSPRTINTTSSWRGVQIAGTTGFESLIIERYQGSGGPAILLGKSRGTSVGDYTIVQNNDSLGSLIFFGADGSDMNSPGARIDAQVDGTPGANDMPGRLVFSTTGDGASTPTERMRIDSSGRLLVGTNTSIVDTDNFQIKDDAGAGILLQRSSGTNGAATGGITFRSSTGNQANIASVNDGSQTSGSSPGRLVFSTTASGASSPTERMRILSDGATIIGDGTTWSKYVSDTVLQVTHDTNPKFVLNNPGNRSYSFGVSTDEGLAIRDESNTVERLRIHSNGKIGISQSSPYADLDITSSTETSTGTLSAHGIRLAAVGAADEDVIPITAGFLDNQYRARAGIGFICKTASAAGYAGAIGFYTRSAADGSGLLRTDERMRLDEGGNLGIGIANPSYRLHSYDTSGAQGFFNGWSAYSAYNASGAIRFGDQTTYQGRIDYDASGNTNFVFENSYSNGTISWKINNTEQLRLSNAGDLKIGSTTNDGLLSGTPQRKLTIGQASNSNGHDSGCIQVRTVGNSGRYAFISNTVYNGHILFTWREQTAGSITSGNNTTVSYTSSSDYRLKDNVVELTNGWERVKQLNPKQFEWKSDPGVVVDGFLAHEAQQVVPESVFGEKDATYEETGDPYYQTMENSRLIPVLTAALKESQTRIETLEAEVAALKARLDAAGL